MTDEELREKIVPLMLDIAGCQAQARRHTKCKVGDHIKEAFKQIRDQAFKEGYEKAGQHYIEICREWKMKVETGSLLSQPPQEGEK